MYIRVSGQDQHVGCFTLSHTRTEEHGLHLRKLPRDPLSEVKLARQEQSLRVAAAEEEGILSKELCPQPTSSSQPQETKRGHRGIHISSQLLI